MDIEKVSRKSYVYLQCGIITVNLVAVTALALGMVGCIGNDPTCDLYSCAIVNWGSITHAIFIGVFASTVIFNITWVYSLMRNKRHDGRHIEPLKIPISPQRATETIENG